MTRLIVDTDIAGDDVFSLLIALLHPKGQLQAITVCCGNVRFEQEVENALYTIERAGRSGEVPVYPGCREPLIAEWVGAEYVHGNDGMGDSDFPRAAQRPEPEHAVDELVRRINESPGALTILAQAPLTNLATAVTRDPTIAEKVAHLYVMGGGVGNITPAAEYNFFVDPEAAKIVVNAGFPLTLFTWALTRTHGRPRQRQARLHRRARDAARRVLRRGQPQGPRIRRQGQSSQRLHAPRLDGVRGDRRAFARARDGGGGRRRRDERRAHARVEHDRHAQPHGP
jgi:inosine-uridine nucleoside N-ribohydrolase